ncbi:MAG: FAD-dependent oxidoreductase [Gemmataceae bacterium]
MSTGRPIVLIGAGLAGSTLAWQLHFRGVQPLLYDRNDPSTASRVAAGLLTPITGKRMAISWNFDRLWPDAVAFYRRVEELTGKTVLHVRPAVRLFQSAEERDAFHQRQAMLAPYLTAIDPPVPTACRNPFGGFAMAPAGYLDVPSFLDLTRSMFEVRERDVSTPDEPDATVVRCTGFAGRNDKDFPWVLFNPTKGDFLRLEIPGCHEPRTIHAGGWISQAVDGTYRAGSTYERDNLNPTPTEAGRAEVERKIQSFLTVPYYVREHRAAVRPIIRESRPVLGRHPQQANLWYFNGLGSKGSLLAPHYAAQLAEAILGRGPIDRDVDVCRLPGAPSCPE